MTGNDSDSKAEPLLGSGQGAWASRQADQATEEAVLGTPVPVSDDPDIIWEGTTWTACPGIFMFCTPLFCSSWRWRISRTRIDLVHGCCGSDEETLDLRRVVDLHFHRNFLQLMLGRGTITIHSASDEYAELKLTTFGTKRIFSDLREAWTRAKVATAVGYDDDDHHGHVH